MSYQNPRIAETAELLKNRLNNLPQKSDILRAVELRALYDELKTLPAEERAGFGKEANDLRQELQALVDQAQDAETPVTPVDVTAPYDVSVPFAERPQLLPSEQGTKHPLMSELETVLDIFYRMGFTAVESRELDDDFHMFGSLNFPEDHPARDDYDTFMTTQTDNNQKAFIAPAHTSTMQHRVLLKHKEDLENGKPIAAVIPG
ncbi:MAG TPA: hypothetical protein VF401_00255, partial [Candidatus Saccharimonadales bacterium]